MNPPPTDLEALANPSLVVAGADEVLHRCAHHGVPIVYLTAGEDSIRAQNRRFLAGFPRGRLFDYPQRCPVRRRDFKRNVLGLLRDQYPLAQFVCLGDNRGFDRDVYGGLGERGVVYHIRGRGLTPTNRAPHPPGPPPSRTSCTPRSIRTTSRRSTMSLRTSCWLTAW